MKHRIIFAVAGVLAAFSANGFAQQGEDLEQWWQQQGRFGLSQY